MRNARFENSASRLSKPGFPCHTLRQMLPGSVSPFIASRLVSPEPFSTESSLPVWLAHLESAMPYLFEADFGGIAATPRRPYLEAIRRAAAAPGRAHDLVGRFRLGFLAHWTSAASFAPVEVEPSLRVGFWKEVSSSETVREMAELVLEAYAWDPTPISRRWTTSPRTGLVLSSHHGEWLAIAVAAYAATRERDPILSLRLREAIEVEVTREAKAYLEFRKARDGVGILRSAALIAQNLALLDRAIEAWELSSGDPIRAFAYRSTSALGARAARFGGAFAESGRLNRELLASENHRHFSLRAPRALRRSPEFLLPIPPFFDEWGARIATHPAIRRGDLSVIVEALYHGWEKAKGVAGTTITEAYPRAVAGILEALPGGFAELAPSLSANVERNLRSGLFHGLSAISPPRFTEQWAAKALSFVAG